MINKKEWMEIYEGYLTDFLGIEKEGDRYFVQEHLCANRIELLTEGGFESYDSASKYMTEYAKHNYSSYAKGMTAEHIKYSRFLR